MYRHFSTDHLVHNIKWHTKKYLTEPSTHIQSHAHTSYPCNRATRSTIWHINYIHLHNSSCVERVCCDLWVCVCLIRAPDVISSVLSFAILLCVYVFYVHIYYIYYIGLLPHGFRPVMPDVCSWNTRLQYRYILDAVCVASKRYASYAPYIRNNVTCTHRIHI